MASSLSPNTQAILLLTAPLIAGRNTPSRDLLTLGEYKKFARFLISIQSQPSDLLGGNANGLINDCDSVVPSERLRRLLDRGFLLGQAVERWQSRAIWVVSRADAEYPKRFKERLKDDAPTVLYGCGEFSLLSRGGLAVVGSRHVDESLVSYANVVGRMAAKANRPVISGGAKGVDLAAMRGALESEGEVVGMLSERLERVSLDRENRRYLMEGRLVLASPYDPQASFNVGHAMQRNKLIYALSDAALVVNADYKKGGTWAGAIEQLERFHMVPVFVRSTGTENRALTALHERGAFNWPNPETLEDFDQLLSVAMNGSQTTSHQAQLFPNETASNPPQETSTPIAKKVENSASCSNRSCAAVEQLFAKVRELVSQLDKPMSDSEIAEYLGISKTQAKVWLTKLVEENVLRKTKKPVKYVLLTQTTLLD